MSTSSHVRPDRDGPEPWPPGSAWANRCPSWVPEVVRDWMDEIRAIRLRDWHGRRGGLLSWHPEPTGGWRARLSSPGLVYTIERVGADRVEAIERSLRARERTLNLRVAIQFDRMLAATHDDSD